MPLVLESRGWGIQESTAQLAGQPPVQAWSGLAWLVWAWLAYPPGLAAWLTWPASLAWLPRGGAPCRGGAR